MELGSPAGGLAVLEHRIDEACHVANRIRGDRRKSRDKIVVGWTSDAAGDDDKVEQVELLRDVYSDGTSIRQRPELLRNPSSHRA